MITDEQMKNKVTKYLINKIDAQYFGKVIIIFQSGKVIHIIEEKSLRLENLNN